MAYRIRNWTAVYENDRSRERDRCSWCALPNKQHGLGYCRLLGMEGGAALYGAFVAAVLVASRQARPRDGWLTQDGTATGMPLTAEDIATITRVPVEVVSAMLSACCSPAVGWLETTELPPDSRPTPARLPPDSLGMEGNGKKEGKGDSRAHVATGLADECTIPAAAAVAEYAQTIAYAGFDEQAAQRFIDYYMAQGWRGRNGQPLTLTAWRALVRTWKTRDGGRYNPPPTPEPQYRPSSPEHKSRAKAAVRDMQEADQAAERRKAEKAKHLATLTERIGKARWLRFCDWISTRTGDMIADRARENGDVTPMIESLAVEWLEGNP